MVSLQLSTVHEKSSLQSLLHTLWSALQLVAVELLQVPVPDGQSALELQPFGGLLVEQMPLKQQWSRSPKIEQGFPSW
jgi:hypothetical protein